ncbi:hypothetical protein CDAR_44641 [Caerostris darwini]|uniref:Uncharacterized protein n=1 Tax=Caerostris darwini TaxID=1538125 RepID=A0AAV4QL20_9ARAC|nr:hypothetical protein CDAR_44641 [Caerostris darwini]
MTGLSCVKGTLVAAVLEKEYTTFSYYLIQWNCPQKMHSKEAIFLISNIFWFENVQSKSSFICIPSPQLPNNSTFHLTNNTPPQLPSNPTPQLSNNLTPQLPSNPTVQLPSNPIPQLPSSPTPQLPSSPISPAPSPTPNGCNKKSLVNGSVYKERLNPQNVKSTQKSESSLPRTSPESKLVAEAQQFSIEAKLKRKKSDVGRSAVLIQTWERRTRNDSLPRRQQSAKNGNHNRFQNNKENIRHISAMPDSYQCTKYAGNNTLSVESLKNGGFVSKVRDPYSEEAMLYQVSQNGLRHDKQVQVNGNEEFVNGHEPEWISLSRKLCAKFVEGHIEHNSADSYLHEEPDGVNQQMAKQQPIPKQTPQPPKQTLEPPQKTDVKKKVVDTSDMTANEAEEPPWIHLSRKLCTKFIEEHIEYPIITLDQSVKAVSVVEPNGDVRIIEKIGKPKERKSKSKKESEPEWVSLSKKLRAKFIESHIDDPETISLDNQLNASDPEENSSESLTDTSQEVATPNKTHELPKNYTHRDSKNEKFRDISNAYENNIQSKKEYSPSTPENENSWEYQQMEFQEESGTFQEQDCSEERFTYSVTNQNDTIAIQVTSGENNNFDKRKSLKNDSYNFTSFAETANAQMFHNTECYNNDVIFKPMSPSNEKTADRSNGNKKLITVQFVSHQENAPQKPKKIEKVAQTQVQSTLENTNNHNSFFNLTTWEEAHYKADNGHMERTCSPSSISLIKEWKSKSLEDICDPKVEVGKDTKSGFKKKQKHNQCLNNAMPVKENQIYKSDDVLDKLDSKISSTSRFSVVKLHENHTENLESRNGVNVRCKNSGEQTKCSKVEPTEDSKYRKINSTLLENGNYTNGDDSTFSQNTPERFEIKRKENTVNSYEDNYQEKNSKPNGVPRSWDNSKSRRNKEGDKEARRNIINFDGNNIQSQSNHFENVIVYENSRSLKYDEFKHSDTSEPCGNNSLLISENKNPKYVEDSRERSQDLYNDQDFKNRRDEKQSKFVDPEISSEGETYVNGKNNNKKNHNQKNYKCNGVVPNSTMEVGNCSVEVVSRRSSIPQQSKREEKIINNSCTDLRNVESNKGMKVSKSLNNIPVNEYANINPSLICSNVRKDESENSFESHEKYKSVQSLTHPNASNESYEEKIIHSRPRRSVSESLHKEFDACASSPEPMEADEVNRRTKKLSSEIKSAKEKSKSCQDVYRNREFSLDVNGMKQNGIDQHNGMKSKITPVIQFQEFKSEADIPLCAKLVSKQNGKRSTTSVSSSSIRDTSPCSEISHVYEDMFKETTSCPSDSETSSWTVMKKNSYYVNGHSASMNDLDYSDSCSMSVKCDYASSCSEQSTLQSRHSSFTSSSFYVNLRDYDSHMLEPSLSRKKKEHKKIAKNGNSMNPPNSNPPTPESLRHLFTSPLNSMHSPPNRTSRLINKFPQESESHYYSTAAAASSAFKHGFDPTPPKPKKTERSSSIKIKDIAHGIILTFRRFQNHSKNSNVSPTHSVDVSHLAEFGSKTNNSESSKSRSKKELKEILKKQEEKKRWGFSSENGRTDSDSGCQLPPSDGHRSKTKRSSSDLVGKKPNMDIMDTDIRNGSSSEKKKTKSGKKNSSAKEKGKKTRSKSSETRTIPTVTRKVQQMADGTLYLVTTVSGDTALPGVYSDSPDTSSELSSHKPVKLAGESNC